MDMDEGDLSDYDIHLIMEALSSRQSKTVASCALSINILLHEIQQQLLDLMANKNTANKTEESSVESRDEDYDVIEFYNQQGGYVMSDEEAEPQEPQDSVLTRSTVPITGSRYKQPESHPCNACSEVFSSKKNLSRHIKHCAKLNTEPSKTCEDAKASDTGNQQSDDVKLEVDDTTVDTHLLSDREPGELVKVPQTRTRNKLTPAASGVPGKVQCEYCGTETLRQHMARHMLIHSGEKPWQCSECDAAYYRKDKLKEHMKKHEPGYVGPKIGKPKKERKEMKCRKCGFTTMDNKEMKAHKMTHPSQMTHKCDHCDKEFVCLSHLEQHAITHRSEKPFMCDICGIPFSREPNLLRHMKSHTEPAPYQCQHCNKPYFRKNELVVHERSHTGEKPFICEICGTAYTSNKYLQRHLFTHTGLRPHKCDICGRAFARPENMRAHRKLHAKQPKQAATLPMEIGENPTMDPVANAFLASQAQSGGDPMEAMHSSDESHNDLGYELPNTSSITSRQSNDHHASDSSPQHHEQSVDFKYPDFVDC